IPVVVETAGHLAGDVPHADEVDVLEGHGAEREVLGTDIASAGDEHLPIDDHQLVVHPIVDSAELAQLAEIAGYAPAQGQRVEQFYVDIGVVIQGGHVEVAQGTADIIQQQ